MKNPFVYSTIAEGDAFCNRQEEQDALIQQARNSQNVVLYSNRRMGKTSLIHQVIKRLKKERPAIPAIYVDLYGTLREKDFIEALYRGISRLESKMDKLLKIAAGVQGTIGMDPLTGLPSITVSVQSSKSEQYLEYAMGVLAEYSQKHKILLVFDEFQEISKYAANGFEKRLRSYVQLHTNICYVFCGSHQHLLMQMFGSAEKAFYQSAWHMALKPIESIHYVHWVKKLFNKKNAEIEEDVIAGIVESCEFQPMPIQQIFYRLWESEAITPETIQSAELEVVNNRKDTFAAIWDSLTLNQRKTLQLVAMTEGEKVYALKNLEKVELNSTSVLQHCLNLLVEHQILFKDDGYRFQDIMFKKWLQGIKYRETVN